MDGSVFIVNRIIDKKEGVGLQYPGGEKKGGEHGRGARVSHFRFTSVTKVFFKKNKMRTSG